MTAVFLCSSCNTLGSYGNSGNITSKVTAKKLEITEDMTADDYKEVLLQIFKQAEKLHAENTTYAFPALEGYYGETQITIGKKNQVNSDYGTEIQELYRYTSNALTEIEAIAADLLRQLAGEEHIITYVPYRDPLAGYSSAYDSQIIAFNAASFTENPDEIRSKAYVEIYIMQGSPNIAYCTVNDNSQTSICGARECLPKLYDKYCAYEVLSLAYEDYTEAEAQAQEAENNAISEAKFQLSNQSEFCESVPMEEQLSMSISERIAAAMAFYGKTDADFEEIGNEAYKAKGDELRLPEKKAVNLAVKDAYEKGNDSYKEIKAAKEAAVEAANKTK